MYKFCSHISVCYWRLFVDRTWYILLPNYVATRLASSFISEQPLQLCCDIMFLLGPSKTLAHIRGSCLRRSRLLIPLKSALGLVGIPCNDFCSAGQGLPPVDLAGFPSPYPPQLLGWGGEIPLHHSFPTLLPKGAHEFVLRRMARLRCSCALLKWMMSHLQWKICIWGYAACNVTRFFDAFRTLLWNTALRKRTTSCVWNRGRTP